MPKTGSSSLRQLLDPYSDVFPARNYQARTKDSPFYPHMRPAEARSICTELGWDFAGYRKFICVRNPWARLVSLHRHICEFDKATPPFRPWLESVAADGSGGGGGPEQKWRRYGSYAFEHFVRDGAGTELVDTVFRLEDIQHHLLPYLASLGVSELTRAAIPHSNDRSGGAPYAPYYDTASRQLVAERYAYEIDRFGYVFGA